jgi:Phage integrase, N-terminal SAM-like domain
VSLVLAEARKEGRRAWAPPRNTVPCARSLLRERPRIGASRLESPSESGCAVVKYQVRPGNEVLDEARRGVLPGMVRTGASFADAAADYLRYIEVDRGRRASTLRGYRSAIAAHLLPAFGHMPVEDVTTEEIDRVRRAHLSAHVSSASCKPGP